MAPPKHKLAREHLELALADIDDEDERGAINALFYAAEAAVVALAEAHGIDTQKHHGLKADAAKKLHGDGLIDNDYGPLLRALNQTRKDVWYEGEEPDFGERSLADVAAEVDSLVEQAEAQCGD